MPGFLRKCKENVFRVKKLFSKKACFFDLGHGIFSEKDNFEITFLGQFGDVVAQFGDVVAQSGDVVAQS